MKKLLSLILFFSLSLIAFTSFSKNKEDESETIDNSIVIDRISNSDIEVSIPSIIFTFQDAEIKLKFNNLQHTKLQASKNEIEFIINGENKKIHFVNGEASFKHRFDKSNSLSIFVEEFSFNKKVTSYPLWAVFVPVVLLLLVIIRSRLKKSKN